MEDARTKYVTIKKLLTPLIEYYDWEYNVDFYLWEYNVDFYLRQYKNLTEAEKLAVAKYSKPKKMRNYKMPNLEEFSTHDIFLIAQWLARKATVHCMSELG